MTPDVAAGARPEGTERVTGRDTRALGAVEAAVAAFLIVAASSHAVRFALAMVPTSLAHDELLSVTKYQAHGPVFALTRYDEPNNHILFNAVSSLLPGRGSAMPVPARVVSIVAVAGLLATLAAWPWRRGRRLEAAALVGVFAGNPLLLGLWLSVRGYGLMALWAALSTVLAIEWGRSSRPRYLFWLGAVIVLGTWTVPTFLLFGAPLLAWLLAERPGRRTTLAGLACGLGILTVHLPVLGAMRRALASYGGDWGEDFASVSGIGVVVRAGLIPALGPGLSGFQTWLVCGGMVGLFLLAWWKRRARVGPFAPVFGAALVFFGLCLVLKSPVLRSTAFVVIPLAICVVSAAGELVRGRPSGWTAWFAAKAAVVGAVSTAAVLLLAARPVRFEPEERWLEVARTIEATFPGGTRLYSTAGPLEAPEPRWGDFLHAQMRHPEMFPGVSRFDREAFAGGSLIVHERPYQRHLSAEALPEGAIQIRIPQRHLGYQAFWLRPPTASGLSLPSGGMVVDRRGVELAIESGHTSRSLVLLLAEAWSGPPLRVEKVPAAVPVRGVQLGRVTLVPLGDARVSGVSLRAVDGVPPVRIEDAWVYPSSLSIATRD